MTDNITRITEMEIALDECQEVLEEMENSLNRLDEIREKMGELFSYYGSEDWYEDRELELPPDVKAGVLSEDLVYDAITDARDMSIRMMELATDIIKNRI